MLWYALLLLWCQGAKEERFCIFKEGIMLKIFDYKYDAYYMLT